MGVAGSWVDCAGSLLVSFAVAVSLRSKPA